MTDETDAAAAEPGARSAPVLREAAARVPAKRRSAPVPSRRPSPSYDAACIVIGVIVAFLAIVLFACRTTWRPATVNVERLSSLPRQGPRSNSRKHPLHRAPTVRSSSSAVHRDEPTAALTVSRRLRLSTEEARVPAFETYVGHDVDSRSPSFRSAASTRAGRVGTRASGRHLLRHGGPSESPMTQSVRGA